jgi:hypothetical protein
MSKRMVTMAALLACGAARAVQLDANIGMSVDADGGSGIDVDFGVSPTEHLSFNLGAGYATGPDQAGNLSGTTIAGGAMFHHDRFGVSLDYDQFDDPTNYHVGTLGARGWFEIGDLRLTLLARQRDMALELRIDLPRQTLRREMEFSAVGTGVQLSFTNDHFSVYGMALSYDYDEDFERFLELPDTPLAERWPRIEALYGSFILQAQGAIDRQAALGGEYTFGRHSLALDVARLHDAVAEASSTSIGLTWHYFRSSHLDWSVTAGMVDSAIVSDLVFVSVALGLHN